MGIFRGGLLVVASVLLFVVFLTGNVLWTLDKSLDYETIKPELVSAVKEAIGEQIDLNETVGGEFEMMKTYCVDNSEYVLSYGDFEEVFEIECEVVAQGQDAVVEYVLEDFVGKVYNGQVEGINFNFAELKNSINSYFYYALIVALVLFVLIFFLAEIKSNSFILTGSLLVISSLPFVKIEKFFSFIPFEFAEYLVIFFSKAYSIFLTSLIVGLIILGVGIVMKFFGVGFKLFGFFNKMKSKGKVKTVVVKEKVVSGKNK